MSPPTPEKAEEDVVRPDIQFLIDGEKAAKTLKANIDDYRQQRGVPPLQLSGALQLTAQHYADYLALTHRFGDFADGKAPAQRVREKGYACSVAQASAVYPKTKQDNEETASRMVVESWKAASSEEANMSSIRYGEAGSAAAAWQEGDQIYYVFVQIYGEACGGQGPSSGTSDAPGTQSANRLDYRGYRIDFGELGQVPNRDAIIASVREQIDRIEGLKLEKLNFFFKSIPVKLAPPVAAIVGNPGSYSGKNNSITLYAQVFDRDRPILLHEFMHAYHAQKLPGGVRNNDILAFYRRAQNFDIFPATSYMMSNVNEYFAMTASVYLNGSAKREPFTREILQSKQPVYYQWLGSEFGRAQ